MKNKTVCIYHSIDLDGWCSSGIVKYWWCKNNKQHEESSLEENLLVDLMNPYNNIKFIGYNYGQPIPNLSEYDKVIMCDISFPKEEMLLLANKLGTNLVWIDHHQRTINEVNQYLIDNSEKEIEGSVTEEGELKAACELTWEYFFPQIEMPEFVRLLGMYDSFRHKNTSEEQKVLEFQYGARTIISNYLQAYNKLVDCILCSNNNPKEFAPEEFRIWESGKGIYSFLCMDAKLSYKNGFEIEFDEDKEFRTGKVFKFICINKERFNPINFGIDYHSQGYDGVACFHYANGKYNFSLYNDNGLVDCSVIAKQFGGGGHFSASGFQCDHETFLSIIK